MPLINAKRDDPLLGAWLVVWWLSWTAIAVAMSVGVAFAAQTLTTAILGSVLRVGGVPVPALAAGGFVVCCVIEAGRVTLYAVRNSDRGVDV